MRSLHSGEGRRLSGYFPHTLSSEDPVSNALPSPGLSFCFDFIFHPVSIGHSFSLLPIILSFHCLCPSLIWLVFIKKLVGSSHWATTWDKCVFLFLRNRLPGINSQLCGSGLVCHSRNLCSVSHVAKVRVPAGWELKCQL